MTKYTILILISFTVLAARAEGDFFESGKIRKEYLFKLCEDVDSKIEALTAESKINAFINATDRCGGNPRTTFYSMEKWDIDNNCWLETGSGHKVWAVVEISSKNEFYCGF